MRKAAETLKTRANASRKNMVTTSPTKLEADESAVDETAADVTASDPTTQSKSAPPKQSKNLGIVADATELESVAQQKSTWVKQPKNLGATSTEKLALWKKALRKPRERKKQGQALKGALLAGYVGEEGV
jgi:hypothetical protein